MKISKRAKRKTPSGFALVATLMMMIVLVVIAVGLLGLSTIELRKAGNDTAMERARANARMGLMIALGELQKNLGPDQRVSADARVAFSGTGDPAHPHWVSVWKSTQQDGKPWIKRDAENGGLGDQRQTSGWNARDERLTTLVSGNEREMVYQDDDAGASVDLVSLVSTGSLGPDPKDEDMVSAPRVEITNSNKTKGSYAWWVGDLGAQANVATRDSTPDTTLGNYQALMLAQDTSWKAFGNDDLKNEDRAKLVSERQLALVDPGSVEGHFHDFTVWSAGLPINVRDGGWRRDLTAFIENGNVPDLKKGELDLAGMNDADNIVGTATKAADARAAEPGQSERFREVSPNFGLLRTWANPSKKVPMGPYRTKSELAKMAGTKVDFRARTTTLPMPVIAEASIYYNLSYYPLAAPVQGNPYGMRVHFYPRVALWNPYNFELEVPQSAVNLHINGAKWIEVTMEEGEKQNYRMFWGLGDNTSTGGSQRGNMFFKMSAATIKPGETLVWSPQGNSVYDQANMANNVLTTTVAPNPGRSFYQDRRDDNQGLFQLPELPPGERPPQGLLQNMLRRLPISWREIVPPRPAGDIQKAKYTQADDYRVEWKHFSGNTLSSGTFNALPMGRFVSCAFQYGDEDELPVEWTSLDPVPYLKTTLASPKVTEAPNRRTRDGFRMRWFEETKSNEMGSGSLAGKPAHLQDSPVGNWNMRASWSFRNPFDNVTDVAPHFFGIYTRDLFDGEVDWDSMNPRSEGGTFHSDPFDQAVNTHAPRILFDVPRTGTEIASLGAFQHVAFSDFIWHPTYALGNSLADPRVPMKHTEPDRADSINRDKGGWNQNSIGYATDGRSSNNNGQTTNVDNWAWHAREFIDKSPLTQTVVYDLSYELNHTLWDSYFLSTGTSTQKQAFLDDPEESPLPNGRIRTNPLGGEVSDADLTDYFHSAPHLLVDGAFNVNSTSVSAWEALLLSGIGKQYGADAVAFPRILNSPGGEWKGKNPSDDAAWSGQRVFNRDEIRRLAEQIVVEVKARGPFISLADFVNRRLSEDATGKKGALQAAIDRSDLNAAFKEEWPLNNSASLPDYKHNDNISDPTRMEQTLKPDTSAWGALGFLTQADLLQFIGPALSARSDTFRIRAYGESLDEKGKVAAKCYCEAVVQRSPNYVDTSDDTLETGDTLNETNQKFGRRFEIVSFRWLKEEEI